MTKKRAYCCLSCSNLPPCSQAANSCAECCKDCGDPVSLTLNCLPGALIDPNDNFYKGYTATLSYYYEEGVPGVMPDVTPFTYETYYKSTVQATYDSIKDITRFNTTDIAKESNYSSFCSDDYVEAPYWGIWSNTESYSNEKTQLTFCVNNSSNPGQGFYCPLWNGCSIQSDDGPNYYSFLPKMPECPPQPNDYATDLRDVVWKIPLKLYDKFGKEIEDPWSILDPPDPFDPCDPIRGVSAPACHFFHTFA